MLMIGVGLALVVYQRTSQNTPAAQTQTPPGIEVEQLLGNSEESGTGMVIQIADKDDPSRLAAEILADRYDPEGPTIRLVEKPKAWLFGEDGSAWLIEADRGRFYIPEGEDNPREGTLTGNVIARRFEQSPGEANTRPDPEADAPVLTATTDEPLRFNLDLLTFETDGLLEIDTDAMSFRGRGAYVVLNEQRGSITTLRVDRGERIVYTPSPAEPAKTPEKTDTSARTNDAEGDAPGDAIAATPPAASPVPAVAPPKIDYYKVIITDNVEGISGGRTISSDLLTVWARLIDNQLPQGPYSNPTATARTPIEAVLIAAVAAQSGIHPGPPDLAAKAGEESRTIADTDPEISDPPPAEPVVLTWDGPLTVEPLDDTPRQLSMSDNLALRFEATDGEVEMQDAASGAYARSLAATYFVQRERVELVGSGGSVVLASPGAGRIEGMNAVEIEFAAGVVTIPTAGELFGKEHDGGGADPSPQTVAWSEAASFVFAIVDGRMTDRLERAGFRGRVRGANKDATIDGDTLLALFDTPEGESPRLLQLNVEGALAEDGRGGTVGGEGLEVHFARGTHGEDIDPTRAIFSGDAFAKRDGRETIRGQWIDASLARDEGGKVIVTLAEAKGEVEFEDGAGIEGRGDALVADALGQKATITSDGSGETAWVSRDGTRITGPDIRLDSPARTVEVFGPGSFAHAGNGNSATESGQSVRAINASWTGRMSFDDISGTVSCLGGVRAESPSADGSIDTVTGDRLEITLAPIDPDQPAEAGTDRLRFAEVFGSPDRPARAESRRYADIAAPMDLSGKLAETPAQEIEELFRLEGAKIRFASLDDTIEVPTAGRLFILDRSPESPENPANDAQEQGPSPLLASDGKRGTTLVTWAESMEFDRRVGRAVFHGDARIANKPIGAEMSDVTADRITASFQPAGDGAEGRSGDLRWAIAEGDALLRMENVREILADRLIYNPEKGKIEALGENGRRVEISDLRRGNTTNARAIRWDLATDRIDIINPGSIIAPE